MPGYRTSAEMRSRIAAALRMGFSQSETARKLAVSRDRVRTVARREGLAPRPTKRHVCECGRVVRDHV